MYGAKKQATVIVQSPSYFGNRPQVSDTSSISNRQPEISVSNPQKERNVSQTITAHRPTETERKDDILPAPTSLPVGYGTKNPPLPPPASLTVDDIVRHMDHPAVRQKIAEIIRGEMFAALSCGREQNLSDYPHDVCAGLIEMFGDISLKQFYSGEPPNIEAGIRSEVVGAPAVTPTPQPKPIQQLEFVPYPYEPVFKCNNNKTILTGSSMILNVTITRLLSNLPDGMVCIYPFEDRKDVQFTPSDGSVILKSGEDSITGQIMRDSDGIWVIQVKSSVISDLEFPLDLTLERI